MQDDQKLPKWNQISTRYHLVFDYLFDTTVRTGNNDLVIDNICNDLFDSSHDWYAVEEFEPDGKLIYRPPPLADVWLDDRGRQEKLAT